MKLKNKIVVFAVVLCALTGCLPASRLRVLDAETPSLHGLASLHGKAVVENATTRAFVVESVTFGVKYRGRELGSARLLLPVEIPAGGETAIRYDFALEGFTLSSLQTLSSRLAVNPGAFTLDAAGVVRWGGVRKKIDMKGMTLTRIMEIIPIFVK